MKARELSSFCMQVAFLLEAGIPIDGGLAILAEDAKNESEKELLMDMSEDVEVGMTLAEAMKKTEQFPSYLIEMSQIGQETGTLEVVMKSLSQYYEKESYLAQTIRNVVTYPIIMVTMLMVVLLVLFTKVIPIFEAVYRQLGAELSPITVKAVQLGTVLTGVSLALVGILVLIAIVISFASKNGYKIHWAEKMAEFIKDKSKVSLYLIKRRICSVLAISVKSGIGVNPGIEMAYKLVSQKNFKSKLERCREKIEEGTSIYEALKETKIFTGMDIQMIKVGSKSGKMDAVFTELSKKYENEVDVAIDNLISKFEPTMVVILAVVVGLILLSVMMPLVGIMASLG